MKRSITRINEDNFLGGSPEVRVREQSPAFELVLEDGAGTNEKDNRGDDFRVESKLSQEKIITRQVTR